MISFFSIGIIKFGTEIRKNFALINLSVQHTWSLFIGISPGISHCFLFTYEFINYHNPSD